MQTEGRGEAARKDPLLSNTIHQPIDPRRDCESGSAHSISQHSSPQAEELNQATESSSASLSVASALRSPYVAPPPHRNQHISGEPNTNMHASSNPIAPVKARQPYSPHRRTSSSGPLSPTPAGKVTAVNTVYTPLRLDSQLLGSSWTGAHQPQPIASPTRVGVGPGGAAYSSYWNVATSPVPYPCGSPTAYGSGLRTMSPSTHSLRHHPQQQSQHQLLNSDGSPMQLSISTPGRESSFISTMPTYTSPSAAGMLHTAILDAPLQLSLVPPTCGDDYPYFSFGNSILQSTPYTPTVQTPTARSYSIYHDTVRELAQQRTEMDNPLSLFQSENSRHHGHDGSPASLSGGAISSASLTPLTVDVAVQLPHLPPRAVSEVSFASGCGAIVPPKIVDGTLVDWTKLGQMSPPSPRLPEPLTARPTTDTDAAAHHGPRGAAQEDEDDAEGSNSSSRNSTPDEEEEVAHDGAESAAVSPDVAVSDGAAMPFGELGRTQRPHEAATSSSGPDWAASGRETRNVAAVSLSDADFAFRELQSRQPAGTPSPERGKSGSGLRVSVSAAAYPRRKGTQPNSPGVAPPGAMLQLGVPDLHLFMPSPLDEGAGGFAPARDGVTGYSPSEHSVSALSLVPHLGMWHASPALLSAHSPAPSVQTALGDLAEVLRLLQSDVTNVYGRVSSNEHTVRHWASCTLDALLRLTVELLHSVRRSAEDEVVTREAAPEDSLNHAALYDEVRKWANGCGDALRATIPAAQRDHDKLEPLLLTSMLARGSIQALLRSLERPYIADDGAAAKADAGHDPATAPAATAATIPASRRISPALPTPNPLTKERVDDLMDSEVLARELSGEWRQFASDYNRKLLRYLFLRVLYKRLSGKDRRTSDTISSSDVHVGAAADATARHGSPASSARGGSGAASTLRTIESAWAEDQLKRWSAIMQRFQLRAECKGNAPPSEESAPVDEATLQLFREALCHDFPSYDVVSSVFSTFRKGESWRCWYILLDRTMECTFRAQEQKELFAYVEQQFLTSPSAPATAALHAASNGQIALEQVEEALEKVEASLKALEEQGKARRVAILQLLLRRIFVLSVVSSVHRAAGKDAVVSNAQLATYVQVQRKSLEEVETQLTAEYAEAETQVTTIRAFLSHMATASRDLATGSESPKNGAPHTPAHPCSATSPVQPSDAQWNTATVGALGSLLARARSHSGTMDRNDDTDDSGCSDEDGLHRHMQDGLRLVEDVTTRVVESIGSLCALLQSDVDLKDVKRGYDVAPTKLPIPSTRALRRLQTSLSETHRAVLVASASLHTD